MWDLLLSLSGTEVQGHRASHLRGVEVKGHRASHLRGVEVIGHRAAPRVCR